MFYLCSIGSNIDPHIHVSRALAELLAHVGPLRLSSVIRTKPVGMHSSNDFLNCLLVVESPLDAALLKQRFVALEVAHGRDRSDPLSKVHDRPLDIDILASNRSGDFATAEVDSYLAELLAELYGHGEVHAPKVALQVALPAPSGKLKPGMTRQVGLGPLVLGKSSESGQRAPTIYLDAGSRHITVPHQ
ncbi:MAG: 2-amino-4-hydroxy-6-hydroxymethyldihydropteridine diphosphokinase [Aeromonas sp.]